MFVYVCKFGFEGVVLKVWDGVYLVGCMNDWVKKICVQCEILIIVGFVFDGMKWDGIYVGWCKGDDLIYVGKVDYGFDKVLVVDFQKCLKLLICKMQFYVKWIVYKGIWVEFKLLVEIEYCVKLVEGKVCYFFFRGFWEDL